MRRFVIMLTFLTRIPVPIRFEVTYEDYVKGVGFTPLIALIIGVPLFLVRMLDPYIHPYVLSACILGLYLLLSGALHIDGLADTMDAFGSNSGKERMLQILRDSHIGTFGVLSIAVYCIGMVVLLPFVPAYCLLLFPLVGRTCALLCAKTHGYARASGLGKSFVEGAKWRHVLVSSAAYAVLAYAVVRELRVVHACIALLPFVCSLLITWVFVRRMSKKIGGVTGDLIGYSVEVSQLIYLLLTYATTVIVTQGVV